MGAITASSTQLKQTGAQFREFSDQYRTLMNKLRDTIEDLGVCWKAEDFNQLRQIYQTNAAVFEQMAQAYASIESILTETGTNFETAIRDNISSMKA